MVSTRYVGIHVATNVGDETILQQTTVHFGQLPLSVGGIVLLGVIIGKSFVDSRRELLQRLHDRSVVVPNAADEEWGDGFVVIIALEVFPKHARTLLGVECTVPNWYGLSSES